MSALDKVLAAHATDLALSRDESDDEQREVEALLLAHAATEALGEASRLILTGNQVPAELILSAGIALGGLELPPDHLMLSDWVEQTAVALAADPKKPYGDVTYADPGYQSDGKKRYPVDTEAHARAAWSYINKGSNASAYSSGDLAKVKAKIKSALSKFGVQVSGDDGDSDDTKKMAASNVMLAAQTASHSWPQGELLHQDHAPITGVHHHPHVHVRDNRHGPGRDVVAMAAAGGWSGGASGLMAAHIHKPITGAHGHPHIHAGDASHGPFTVLSKEASGHADDSWG